jgi:hypothetical protein
MKVIVKDGKINGKPIIKAWESITGWYWFAIEEVEPGYFYGFVIGIYPEWGYFSEKELKANFPLVWEVKPCDIPFIDKEVRT